MKYTKGDTIVSFEKLWFLQKRHAARYASLPREAPQNPRHDLAALALKPIVKLLGQRAAKEDMSFYSTISSDSMKENYVRSILWADAQNYTQPNEFINRNIYFFVPPSEQKLQASLPALTLRQIPPTVYPTVQPASFISLIDSITELESITWSIPEIKNWIHWVINQGAASSLAGVVEPNADLDAMVRKAWTKLVYQYIRWATAAGKPGPDCAETLGFLGKEETVERLKFSKRILLQQASDPGEVRLTDEEV